MCATEKLSRFVEMTNYIYANQVFNVSFILARYSEKSFHLEYG